MASSDKYDVGSSKSDLDDPYPYHDVPYFMSDYDYAPRREMDSPSQS